jgi:hypothetical protein
MAQISVTKLLDGARNAVFHISINGTGVGELVDEILIDPATSFDPAHPPAPSLRIERLWYDLSGFGGRLEYDYLTSDTPVWSMSEGSGGCQVDFECIGGLADRSNGLDGLGKLKLTTSGLDAGDFGTIIVHARKG